jgi:hypothetical protein
MVKIDIINIIIMIKLKNFNVLILFVDNKNIKLYNAHKCVKNIYFIH